MVKLTDLQAGDIVRVVHDGEEREGIVTDIDRDDNKVCIDNGVQDFWYAPEQIMSIPLDEDQLFKLGFERKEIDGGIKYMKGPFRVLTPQPGNFSHLEIWYREDRRHFKVPLTVHELQNHHLEMTKVPLEKGAVH